MGILDTLIDELNKQPGLEGEFKRLHSQPEKLITVRGVGVIRRPVTQLGEKESTMTYPQVINDANAGNDSNTYWRRPDTANRPYCVEIGPDRFLRDKAGRVRRFGTREAAAKALKAAMNTGGLNNE